MTHTQTQGADGAGTKTAGEDSWTFDRTRAYLLAELERLKADLNTVGEDLTGDQGKAVSWLDVALGRVANVASVLSTVSGPAPTATPGVPDSLRALSEAFAETACCASCTTPLDCYQGKPCRLEPAGSRSGVVDHEFKSHPDVFWPAARGEKTFEYRRDDRGGYDVGQTVRLHCYDLTRGYHAVPPLERRITNILRGGEFELPQGYCILSLAPLDAHPAGQAGDAGAEEAQKARSLAVDLEQCSLFVDSAPLRHSMTDAAKFLRALAARPEAPSDAGWSREDLEAFVAREWPEGRSAGAAARELVRALGVRGLAPTLQRLLTDLLGQINFASTDRAQILADFANAAPEAARMAKIDSFERWNPRVFDPTPPSDPAPSGQAEG